ncbi:hypothetical protein [Thermodesulfovibrio sp.]|uniref:Cytochrome c domain-containing protein n=2 Tax=Thermodesulfovibrio TaxID=28261 RepID=A0A2J6WR65_9BACT|nr:MAG: hypothetical protein C0186_00045 [Thermodesulfovibrio aggregans]
MRIITVILISFFIMSGNVFALKCDKCHKDDKSLNKIFQERQVKTKQELFDKLRKGQKAKLHQHLTDKDINEAAEQMKLR